MALDPWAYVAATALGALAFVLVWLHRTVYSGLKDRRS